jgi:hypothetical protein
MKQSHTSSEHVGKIIAGGLHTAALAKMPHAPEWPESWEARKRSNEELLETLPVEVREECRLTGPDEAMPEFQLPWGRVRIEYTPEDEEVDGITKRHLTSCFAWMRLGLGPNNGTVDPRRFATRSARNSSWRSPVASSSSSTASAQSPA